MNAILNKYLGRWAFVGAFIALSVASTSAVGNTATGTVATAARCGVFDCTAKAANQGLTTPANVASRWGRPIKEDDFDSGALDTATGWSIYNSSNGDPKRDARNVGVSGGALELRGTLSNANSAGSGVAQSFSQKYGRWEVRARADLGAGYSPTILLWPQDNNWPKAGEIDLLESLHGDRQKAIAAVHNLFPNNFKTQGISGSQADWHTYAVDWLPDHITFYVDDAEQWNVTDPKLIPTSTPMHLALQNDAGCGWIECPDASTKAVTNMQVDWVKVYALAHA